ncbi:phosphatidylinositol n-acetylglucosaminyltransferase subunit q-related [Anaeramoeba ignava]|uniref:Phosphatidylinositol n-acetylglucosaminyltransferase subunit q-related n=1 Tax=Anaeramoeba ignava TaxID=1746090 RepID=A0A9Q0LYG2_ANAIG|nr:phosphatidylinositol n-acetylglucosaminyltransferase subunit q-related [Anaeramoeba ignava]
MTNNVPFAEIFWPSRIAEISGYLVGWNIRGFIGCVATIIPLKKAEKLIEKPEKLKQHLEKLKENEFYEKMFEYCSGTPEIIGIYFADNLRSNPSPLSLLGRQTSSFWITMKKGPKDYPVLKEIHCCGFKFKAKSQIIFYQEPKSQLYFLSSKSLSIDLSDYYKTKGKKKIEKNESFETTARQINSSLEVEYCVNKVLEKMEKELENIDEKNDENSQEKNDSSEKSNIEQNSNDSESNKESENENSDSETTSDSDSDREFESRLIFGIHNTDTGTESELVTHSDKENDNDDEDDNEDEKDDENENDNNENDNNENNENDNNENDNNENDNNEKKQKQKKQTLSNPKKFKMIDYLYTSFRKERTGLIQKLKLIFIYNPFKKFMLFLRLILEYFSQSLNKNSIFGEMHLKDWTITGQQLYLKVRTFFSLPVFYQGFHKKWSYTGKITTHYLMFYNTICLWIFDTLLGIFVGIIAYKNLNLVINQAKHYYTLLTSGLLRSGVSWLMGWPAGFKLNDGLNEFFGLSYLYIIDNWIKLISKLYGFVWYIFSAMAILSGFGGLSLLLSLISDIISFTTFHIYVFFFASSKLFKSQYYILQSLLYLFKGTKRNVLRNRTDSFDYSLGQLMLGTIIFTLGSFLFPTFALYYFFFAILNIILVAIQVVIGVLLAILNYLPLFPFLVWFFRPQILTCAIFFDLIDKEVGNDSSDENHSLENSQVNNDDDNSIKSKKQPLTNGNLKREISLDQKVKRNKSSSYFSSSENFTSSTYLSLERKFISFSKLSPQLQNALYIIAHPKSLLKDLSEIFVGQKHTISLLSSSIPNYFKQTSREEFKNFLEKFLK